MMMMMMMKQKKLVDDTDCFWFGIGDRDVVRLMSSMEYEDEVVEVGGIAYYTSSLFIMVLCSFGVWIVVREDVRVRSHFFILLMSICSSEQ